MILAGFPCQTLGSEPQHAYAQGESPDRRQRQKDEQGRDAWRKDRCSRFPPPRGVKDKEASSLSGHEVTKNLSGLAIPSVRSDSSQTADQAAVR